MANSLAERPDARHRERLETVRPRMAKALNNVEMRAQIGRAIQRCFALAGLSQKEAAALMERDTAQVARWISGDERPQVDVLFSVPQLREAFVLALAEIAGEGIEVQTVVTIRRSA